MINLLSVKWSLSQHLYFQPR